MVFSSLTFLLLFLPILYLLYFIVPSPRWRNGVLIAMSLLFYGWGEPVWILAMLFSTGVNYVCGLLLTKVSRPGARKLILTVGVIASMAFLAYFKYAAFLLNSAAALVGSSWRMTSPGLPIGISFYTFQILTYSVDVYRGKAFSTGISPGSWRSAPSPRRTSPTGCSASSRAWGRKSCWPTSAAQPWKRPS